MTDEVMPVSTAGVRDVDTDRSIRELLGDQPLDQPIELLVQLADDGEIDPWNLDLIEVTDAFLERIDEGDLIVTARTLFYASVLLRMKSDEIVTAAANPEAFDEPPPEPFEAVGNDPIATLEREMDRRLTRKRARGTPATLADLIRELRSAERDRWWKESRTYDTSGNGYRGPQTLDYREMAVGEGAGAALESVSTTSHHEDLEGLLEPLIERLGDAFDAEGIVDYDDLCGEFASPARTYLGLVFLEHRGAVRLDQAEMYGPLTVRPGPNGLAAGRTPRIDEDHAD